MRAGGLTGLVPRVTTFTIDLLSTNERDAMSFNTFGHLFRVTTFGESHGIALGCVVDGCPPGLPLEAEEIQAELDRRKPGQSRFTTQRREPDQVRNQTKKNTEDRTGGR